MPRVEGKFLRIGNDTLYVRGVTYGTFRPGPDGSEFPDPAVVEKDFVAMSAAGVNTVRTYTTPPLWLLDTASRAGLRVMVGLGAERYVGYLNNRRGAPDIVGIVRQEVRRCAGHPAVLGYVLGNEIPAGVVRWHGRRRIEKYLERLWRATREEDPDALVSYANFPSTEYLQLDFLDLVCFNVFLESPTDLGAYLQRLHHIAGDRPLILAEVGLDSRRNGDETQAESLEAQVRTAFTAGCAGVFVYAWTDEWHTGAGEVVDWDFGLTRRDRSSKPSLARVSVAFAEVPFPPGLPTPKVSVLVCTYQGTHRIARCLEGIGRLQYPDFETIVVDDGSTDETAEVAAGYEGVRVISTEHRGLGHARNVAMEAAKGEIIAYLDDDARPDPLWLAYLVNTFSSTDHAAVGGPNIAPSEGGFFSQCAARSPGNPVHVLLSDDEAEHVPGCNMALRRSRLEEIGGFDPRFRAAGDDVDFCWRILERGWTIGFSPGAMVWHDPRPSLGTYIRQQIGYGQAEAMLERKWPEKYNYAGQAVWRGRLYGTAIRPFLGGVGRIYHGVWGQAPFQSIYEPPAGLGTLLLTPQWYLGILALGALTIIGALWAPLLLISVALLAAVSASLTQALAAASRVRLGVPHHHTFLRLAARGTVALLHMLQPLARLRGHLGGGLTPWRRRSSPDKALPLTYRTWFWSEDWHPAETWIQRVEEALGADGAAVLRGGDFDRFDLEVPGGTSASIRILMAVEEHGAGRQLVRVRVWPHWSAAAWWFLLFALALAAGAALDTAWVAVALFGSTAVALTVGALLESAGPAAAVRGAISRSLGEGPGVNPAASETRYPPPRWWAKSKKLGITGPSESAKPEHL